MKWKGKFLSLQSECALKDAGTPVFLIVPLIRNHFSLGALKHRAIPDSSTSACSHLDFQFFLHPYLFYCASPPLHK